MKDESIKIEIEEDNCEESLEFFENVDNLEYINENEDQNKKTENLKEDNDMESDNKTVVNDFKDEKLVGIGVENEEMDLFFILDRSGSMYGSERDTINGFNSFIEKQMVKNPNIRVTTVLFNNDYMVLYSRKPITEIKPLTDEDYYVRGSTALLDAIGKTVTDFEREINKAMFVVTTDGLENSSREYTRDQIRNMVENSGFEFIFIGADIDSYSEASRIGFKRTHVANYRKSRRGINNLYSAVDKATDMVCYNQDLDEESWKEDLE